MNFTAEGFVGGGVTCDCGGWARRARGVVGGGGEDGSGVEVGIGVRVGGGGGRFEGGVVLSGGWGGRDDG